MTGSVTEADVEGVARGWIEGFGWNVIIRPKLISGGLRMNCRNVKKEVIEL